MQIYAVTKELFLQQSTVSCGEHRNLICFCISYIWMQAAVLCHTAGGSQTSILHCDLCAHQEAEYFRFLSGIPDFHLILWKKDTKYFFSLLS